MKAIVRHNYGSPDVLEIADIEKPTAKDDEVLIKVHATAVTPFDWHILTGTPYIARLFAGLLKPKHKVLGINTAGQVEAVGVNVKRFQPGDQVFGHSRNHGGFAEYVCAPEAELMLKPPGMSFEEAAAVPLGAVTALVCLCDLGQMKSGQKVLINGASGGVGTLAVQIAKSFGAEVTGVCSTRNLELVRSLGADQVIDYTQEDFAQKGVRYDLIIDAVAKRSFSDCKRALSPQGVYVTTEFSPTLVLQGAWVSKTGSKKLVPMPPKEPNRNIQNLYEELLEAGKLTPVIDRCYPLSEVPEAFRYYAKGHAQGRVVITI
jgi:NADPH:quinone reductase-like Zn-dependent oxidoreductase